MFVRLGNEGITVFVYSVTVTKCSSKLYKTIMSENICVDKYSLLTIFVDIMLVVAGAGWPVLQGQPSRQEGGRYILSTASTELAVTSPQL